MEMQVNDRDYSSLDIQTLSDMIGADPDDYESADEFVQHVLEQFSDDFDEVPVDLSHFLALAQASIGDLEELGIKEWMVEKYMESIADSVYIV